jgi:hypothetical protein
VVEVAHVHEGPVSVAGEDPTIRLDLVVKVGAISELG